MMTAFPSNIFHNLRPTRSGHQHEEIVALAISVTAFRNIGERPETRPW